MNFEDVELRSARIGFRQVEETHIMENIVYDELRIRGFRVDVGVAEKRERRNGAETRSQLEVDFVANLGSRSYYIQSAFQIPDVQKTSRKRPLF